MTNATLAPASQSLNQFRRILAYFPPIAGLLLLVLLPIGVEWGINHPAFDLFFLAHMLVLVPAVLASLGLFYTCARRTTLGAPVLLGSGVLFLAILLLLSLLPITSRDALIHHLVIPQWWLDAGSIKKFPWHEWSYYPMLINLAFTSILKFQIPQLTSVYHALYLILLSGTVSSFVLYKTKDYDATSLAFLTTLSMPALFRLGSIPLVDLGLAFFATHALCHFVYWVEGKRKFAHLVLIGISWGLAVGCKYNGLLALGLCAPLGLLFALRHKVGVFRLGLAFVICGIFFAITYAPWAMRNYAWTHNPFYPLFNQFFSTAQVPQILPKITPLETRSALYGESWLMTALIPIRMLITGQDNVPARFDGVLSPILALLVVPAFFYRRKPWATFFGSLVLFYLLFALFLNSARVRYLAPVIGPAIIVAIYALYEISQIAKARYRRETLLVGAFAILMWADFYAANLLRNARAFEYFSGKLSDDAYLADAIPEYRMIQFMNAELTENSRTYLVNTGNRFYYYKTPVFSGGHFSAGPLIQIIRAAKDAPEIKALLEKKGLSTQMLANTHTSALMTDNLSPPEVDRWNQFQSASLTLRHEVNGYSLWEIK
jgi:hypothetical protein